MIPEPNQLLPSFIKAQTLNAAICYITKQRSYTGLCGTDTLYILTWTNAEEEKHNNL